jgi:hypothetical protein
MHFGRNSRPIGRRDFGAEILNLGRGEAVLEGTMRESWLATLSGLGELPYPGFTSGPLARATEALVKAAMAISINPNGFVI